jgi:hypothetical protein
MNLVAGFSYSVFIFRQLLNEAIIFVEFKERNSQLATPHQVYILHQSVKKLKDTVCIFYISDRSR